MKNRTKLLIGAMFAAALFFVASYAVADGEWLRVGPVWLKGTVKTGSSGVALTNATGNLVTTTGTYTGNVGVGGTLTVTGATTHIGAVTAPTGTFSGPLSTTSTLAVTGASALSGNVTVTGTAAVTGNLSTAGNLSVTGTSALSGAVSVTSNITTQGNLSVTGTSALSGATTVKGTFAVTGVTTFIGATVSTVPPQVSMAAAVSAAGTDKTGCTVLTKEYNTATGTALQGVCLAPIASAVGLHQYVFNDSAATLVVYPADADNAQMAVNDLGLLTLDQGYALGPQSSIDCTAYTAAKLRCVYTPGSRSTIAGAGTNQATGTAMASTTMGSFVAVTGANATVAVTLPTGGSTSTYTPGCITVQSTVNTNTAYLLVYGNNSDDDTINGGAADAVYNMGAAARIAFCTTDGVAWLTR